ncbi:MAG: response regulator [Candidatus Omnitrophica bacterium]|jgi:DNA-binding response OmpR family regulator|nr:response regulator [Candidatus Omnitrophota bacterium]MDD5080329.1 response regulator [Candidatus Omnitrophota bacterium]
MKAKILLVDDEPVVREIVGKKLAQKDYEVYTAADGDEGMRCARDNRPNLILLDLRMPNKDGLDMLKELKQDKVLCEVPVIVVSARSSFQEIREGRDLGAAAYVVKPVQFSDLMFYVERYAKA